MIDLGPDDVVLTTMSSTIRTICRGGARTRVVHVRALPEGHSTSTTSIGCSPSTPGESVLLAVTGASNVTGVVPPVHDLAERVHAVGGRILVDAAQLVAHRPVDMRPHDDPGRLDFLALSGHKMYAPFGTGALISRRDGFLPRPHQPGGGTVRAVTVDEVRWADLPDREEGGSPNVVGAVALAAAAGRLTTIGLDRIAAHEQALTGYAMAQLASVPGLTIHGPTSEDATLSRRSASCRSRSTVWRRATLPPSSVTSTASVCGAGVLRPALCRTPAVAPAGGDAGRGGDRRCRRHGADQSGRLQRHR